MCKVLVVEDDKEILHDMKKTLVELFPEHKIYTTISSKEGLAKIEELNFDLLFFNSLESRDPNGIKFAESCRESNPFIIMCYMSDELSKERLFKLSKVGVDSFLEKPVDDDFLKIFVINALKRHDSLVNRCDKEAHKKLQESVDNMINMLEKKLYKRENGVERKWTNLKNWMNSHLNWKKS